MSATKLIFQGVKFYWRTRNTIDVTVVEHSEQRVTEVILFDPSFGTEASRIYLSSLVLYSKLDQDDIELQLSFAKRNSVPITEKFVDGIINKAKSDFILNRLVISEYSAELKRVVVALQLSGVDAETIGLICEKPAVFEPFKTVHFQTLMAGVVDQAIAALEEEKDKLHTECDKAGELQQIAEISTKALSNKQRWRIPIVFIKVAKSKRLNGPDAKIWTAVTQNMRTEEDAVRMATALGHSRGLSITPTAAGTPALSRTASVSGLQLAISPCITPRQSKLHQTTAATRHRVEAGTPTHSHNHSHSHQFSRQNSARQVDGGGTAGVTVANNEPLRAGEQGLSTKRKTGGVKASQGPKKHVPKSVVKRNRKSLLARLRKTLNASFSATAEQQHGIHRDIAPEESDGAGDVAASDVSADSADSETDEIDEQSALQLMIASLAALNTSLRASFAGSVSGKSHQSGTVKKKLPSSVGAAGNGEDGDCGSVPAYTVDTVLSPEEVERQLNIAIEQASAGAALVPVPLPAPVSLSVKLKPERKNVSFTAGTPDSRVVTTSSSTGSTKHFTLESDLVSHEGSSKGSEKAARPLAAVHKFISEMVNWRAVNNNKVYAAENDAE